MPTIGPNDPNDTIGASRADAAGPGARGATSNARAQSDRRYAYRRLVELRKQCRACHALTNPSQVAAGSLDSQEIGPYTRWHGDLHARLVVVGKDFAPVPQFIEARGRPGLRVRTNLRLRRFLEVAGFQPGSIAAHHDGQGIFMTNSVLCLPGGESMRTRVRESEVRTCATTFLGETLGIVRPRVVASLGNHAMRAVMYAYDVSPSRARVSEARADQGLRLPDGSVLFAMPHPVASKTVAQHEAAWRRIRCWLESGGSEA